MSKVTEEQIDSAIMGWAFEVACRIDEGYSKADIVSWLIRENGVSNNLANQIFEAGINYSREVTSKRAGQLSKRAKLLILSGIGVGSWSFIQEDAAYLFYTLAGIAVIFGLIDFRNAAQLTFGEALASLTNTKVS